MNRTFVVEVKHDGTPLRGASVKVTSHDDRVRFSELTEPDGTVHVANLPAGDYWMDVEMFGIGAAHHCFHVERGISPIAKRKATYEWGESAEGSQSMAGRIVDPQPGTGGNLIWNITHPVDIPISGANLTLHDPVTGQVIGTRSDENGVFAFDAVPQRTYVLHVEGSDGGRPYDPSDLLLKISPAAKRNGLLLTRQEGGGGSCYGTGLVLR
jgi:hypothetical protein